MKKRLIGCVLRGFPLGIAIGFVVTLINSINVWDGSFYLVTQELIDMMGNELNAVILQTVLWGIMGFGFSMTSVIYEIDSWSLARQTGIIFAVVCIAVLPAAYIANWMEHSIGGVLSYVGKFIATFVVIWIITYLKWKRRIKKMNDSVKKANGTE